MAHRDHGSTDGLLQELLWAYGPCGQEDAVRAVCARELQSVVDDMWVDDAGNLIGYIAAGGRAGVAATREHRYRSTSAGPVAATRVMAHMDELSMLVKRIEPDGTLHLTQLGTMYPGNFGLGPVAVLGDRETLTAVLTLGSEHTTKESPRIWETKPDQGDKALDWRHVYVFTGSTSSPAAPTSNSPPRACIPAPGCASTGARGRWSKSATTSVPISSTTALQRPRCCARPVCCGKTGGGLPTTLTSSSPPTRKSAGWGGSYASASLPGDLTLALEVGPSEQEYGTTVAGGPIIGYSAALCVYDKAVADRLMRISADRGLAPQAAVLGAFESDASHSKASGLTPRAGLLCLPTLSTHGYEVISRSAIEDMAVIIVDFLLQPRGNTD